MDARLTRLSAWFALTLLAGCSASSPCVPQIVTQTRTVDSACDWDQAIYISRDDVLSDATARQILAHNAAGAQVCGWQTVRAPMTKAGALP